MTHLRPLHSLPPAESRLSTIVEETLHCIVCLEAEKLCVDLEPNREAGSVGDYLMIYSYGTLNDLPSAHFPAAGTPAIAKQLGKAALIIVRTEDPANPGIPVFFPQGRGPSHMATGGLTLEELESLCNEHVEKTDVALDLTERIRAGLERGQWWREKVYFVPRDDQAFKLYRAMPLLHKSALAVVFQSADVEDLHPFRGVVLYGYNAERDLLEFEYYSFNRQEGDHASFYIVHRPATGIWTWSTDGLPERGGVTVEAILDEVRFINDMRRASFI